MKKKIMSLVLSFVFASAVGIAPALASETEHCAKDCHCEHCKTAPCDCKEHGHEKKCDEHCTCGDHH